MDTPTRVRFDDPAKENLSSASKDGIKQVDLIRLAVDELFAKYTTDKALRQAYFKYRMKGGQS